MNSEQYVNVNVVTHMTFPAAFANLVHACGACTFKKLIFILPGVKTLLIGCIGSYVYGVNEASKSNSTLSINYARTQDGVWIGSGCFLWFLLVKGSPTPRLEGGGGWGGGGKLRKKALGNDFVDPCFLSFVDRIPWKIEENVATVFFT